MKVPINGFGRIGRAAFNIVLETPESEPVAVNDLAPPASLAYLLKYDTAYGRYERRVEHDGEHLIVDGKPYRVFAERDPARLPWGSWASTSSWSAPAPFGTRRTWSGTSGPVPGS
jgi:glyceraldehyde 3-phosphate dehydrogenase